MRSTGDCDTGSDMTDDTSTQADEAPLVRDVLPRLAEGLERELLRLDEADLAKQVNYLRVRRPCSCDDDFCQSFYTEDHESGTPFGADHRTVPLFPDSVMVNLDVVEGRLVFVEIII